MLLVSNMYFALQLWNTKHSQEKVVPAIKESLENLGLDYVDLYLVHWPFAFQVSKQYYIKNIYFRK